MALATIRKFGILPCLILLSACALSYDRSVPLPQQLAGQSRQDQVHILQVACLNEVERITPFKTYSTRRQSSIVPSLQRTDAKNLCFAMGDQLLDRSNPVITYDQCDQRITQDSHIAGSNFRAPENDLANMQQICHFMTDERLLAKDVPVQN